MNKATIIEDAITYIQELQKTSQILSDQLHETEGSSEEPMRINEVETAAAEDMKKCGIKVFHSFFSFLFFFMVFFTHLQTLPIFNCDVYIGRS